MTSPLEAGSEPPKPPHDPGITDGPANPPTQTSPTTPQTSTPLNFKAAVNGTCDATDEPEVIQGELGSTGTKGVQGKDKAGAEGYEEWAKRLTKIAQRPWKTKDDEHLRPMVAAEEEALAAWTMGVLTLDAPPYFLVCTHPLAHRIAFLHFFEAHLEGKLVAVVPSIVKMPDHIAEKTLLAQLATSEKKGKQGYDQNCALICSVKRVDYHHATRRLTFVVRDNWLADSWHRQTVPYRGVEVLLLSPSKLEQEDVQMEVSNETPHEGEKLQYQLRVLTHDMSALELKQVLGMSTDRRIVSIAREAATRSDAYDSNYFLVAFDDDRCPQQLQKVTYIAAGSRSIFLHHFRHQSRVPCFNCFSPEHTISKCAKKLGEILPEHNRSFVQQLKSSKPLTLLELQHMSVAERLAHITETAQGLSAVMEGLKATASKSELLAQPPQEQKPPVSQVASTNDVLPVQPPAEEEEGWFDPAAARKGKGNGKNGKNGNGKSKTIPPKETVNSTGAAPAVTKGPKMNVKSASGAPEAKKAISTFTVQSPTSKARSAGGPKAIKLNGRDRKSTGVQGGAKSSKARRKREQATLAEIYAHPSDVKATEESEENEEARQADSTTDATPLATATLLVEQCAAAATLAIAVHDEKSKKAKEAKEAYHNAASAAHNDALMREAEKSTAADNEGSAASSSINGKEEVAKLKKLIKHISLLDHLQRRAAQEVDNAQAGMLKAVKKAKKAATKLAKLRKATDAPQEREQRKKTPEPKTEGTQAPAGSEENMEAQRLVQIKEIRAFLEEHFATTHKHPAAGSLEPSDNVKEHDQSPIKANPSHEAGEAPEAAEKMEIDSTGGGSDAPPPITDSGEEPAAAASASDTPVALDATLTVRDLGSVAPPQ